MMRTPRLVISGLFTSSHRGSMDRCAFRPNLHAKMLGNANQIISCVAQNTTESRSNNEIHLNTVQDKPYRKTHSSSSVSA